LHRLREEIAKRLPDLRWQFRAASYSTPQILAAGTKSEPCKSAGQHTTSTPQIYDGRHYGSRRSYQNGRAAR